MSADVATARLEALLSSLTAAVNLLRDEVSALRTESAKLNTAMEKMRTELDIQLKDHSPHQPPCYRLKVETELLGERIDECRLQLAALKDNLEEYKKEQAARWREQEGQWTALATTKQTLLMAVLKRIWPFALAGAGITGGAAALWKALAGA